MANKRKTKPDPEILEALRIAYEEVCKAHDGISEFRAKLLALLPIASGAGIFLLLDLKDPLPAPKYLVAIGIFGGLIAMGLYIYELRGIQKCKVLTDCGSALEKEILKNPQGKGAFTDDSEAAFGFVGATWAARIVYPSVIGGWAYVSLSGLDKLCSTPDLVIAGVVGLAFVLFGVLVGRRQGALKDQQKSSSRREEKRSMSE